MSMDAETLRVLGDALAYTLSESIMTYDKDVWMGDHLVRVPMTTFDREMFRDTFSEAMADCLAGVNPDARWAEAKREARLYELTEDIAARDARQARADKVQTFLSNPLLPASFMDDDEPEPRKASDLL